MEASRKRSPAGIIDSLGIGYSLVVNHLWLLSLPVALDLFLWLGPSLTAPALFRRALAPFQVPLANPEAGVEGAEDLLQALDELATRFNLFSLLGAPPLGMPGLMAGRPGINLVQQEIASPSAGAVIGGLLLLVGLFLSTVYLSLLARVVARRGSEEAGAGPRRPPALSLRRIARAWWRLMGFLLLLGVGIVILSIPLGVLTQLLALFSPGLSSFFFLVGMAVVMWSLFYLFFTVHAILMDGLPVRWAMMRSVMVVRRDFLPTLGLIAVTLTISVGMEQVWGLARPNSWLEGVAILGNAFIHTGLIAATFVFYRERVTPLEARPHP
ncbi:MAG: hypothetical protein D6759_13840 [Chloroflexi bacterium]|nr:MAG: hypothetical protein D6759_13840 [Chloroflexota bacterium]